MKTWIVRSAAVLTVLVALWLGLVWSGVLPRSTESQRRALALLHAPPEHAHGQHNAFELIWLLDYDIPESERASVMAEDIAALKANPNADASNDLPSRREGRFPRRLDTAAGANTRCAPDCLARVRADPEPWRQRLAEHARRLAALRELGRYDHNRTLFPMNFATPIPPYQNTGNLQLAEAALTYLDHDSDTALTRLCQDMGAWRKLKGRSDSLIAEMVGVGALQAGAKLYADIRSELPVDHSVPEVCATTFALPEPSQRMNCDVIRTEFALLENAFGNTDREPLSRESGLNDIGMRLLFNGPATLATAAPGYAALCQLADRPVSQWPSAALNPIATCHWQDHLFNPYGCELIEREVPNFQSYFRRDRDLEGVLRAVQLTQWLAQQADPGAAFESRPESLQSFEQSVIYANGEVIIDLFEPRAGEPPQWRIALPGSRQPAAASGQVP